MEVEITLQIPGRVYKELSITLSRGADKVTIPISKEVSRDIQFAFPDIPTQW